MLETVDLSQSLSKAEYKRRFPPLQRRLHQLQRTAHEAGLPSLIVFEGWRTAGKSTTISKLTSRLEPRGFTLHSIREPRTYETHMPWMWRYWCRIPARGEIAIFHRSWYHEILSQRAQNTIDQPAWLRKCRDVRFFEDAMFNDRCLVMKLFLHIDKKEQRRRLEEMAASDETSWLLTEADWERHERYDEIRAAVEETLQQTEAEWGPWFLINATDRRWTRVRVFEVLIEAMEAGLERLGVSAEDLST